MQNLASRLATSAAMALLVTACGGGSPGSSYQDVAAAIQERGAAVPLHAISVQVVDAGGAPVRGVPVEVLGDPRMQGTTDAAGNVTAEGQKSTQPLIVVKPDGAYYPVSRRLRLSATTAERRTEVIVLEPQRTVVILGVEPMVTNADRSAGTLVLEVGVFGAGGQFEASLAPQQFQLQGAGCPMGCWPGVEDLDGNQTEQSYMDGYMPDGVATVALRAGRSPQDHVVGLILDDGAAMQRWDSTGARLAASKRIIGALGGRAAALAVTRDDAVAPLKILAPFTTDVSQMIAAIDSLEARGGGAGTVYRGLSEFAQYLSTNAPSGSAARRVALLAVDGDFDGCRPSGGYCQPERNRAIEAVRDAGATTVVIGNSSRLARLAALTGGAYLEVDDPGELAQAAAALPAVLEGGSPRYRLELRVKGTPGMFLSGGTLGAVLDVAFSAESKERTTFAVPIR